MKEVLNIMDKRYQIKEKEETKPITLIGKNIMFLLSQSNKIESRRIPGVEDLRVPRKSAGSSTSEMFESPTTFSYPIERIALWF